MRLADSCLSHMAHSVEAEAATDMGSTGIYSNAGKRNETYKFIYSEE
jgi:hypothetical protein